MDNGLIFTTRHGTPIEPRSHGSRVYGKDDEPRPPEPLKPMPRRRVRARGVTGEGQFPMSIARKLAHKAKAIKGGAKKKAARVAGSPRLEAEGRGDQVEGNLEQAGAKVKDALKH
jgi:uncharacterized protein YjbJ (UPF0337 family)